MQRTLLIRPKAVAMLLLAGTVSAALFGASFSAADDTEIFFSQPSAGNSRTANVMFMFDTSGSMGWTDGQSVDRITRLKQAMLDVLDTTTGVNIGIGAFNGDDNGGAIMYPAVDPDSDVCPGAACDSIDLTVPVREPDDDAEQSADGSVITTNDALIMSETAPEVFTSEFTISAGNDDAVQHSDGTVTLDSEGLELFHRPGFNNNAGIGLRFTDVDLPAGATIVSATVSLESIPEFAAGVRAATIGVDTRTDSPEFSASAPDRPMDRLLVPTQVAWPDMIVAADRTIRTPDIAEPVRERMSGGNWSSGDPITVLIGFDGPDASDETSRRVVHSADSTTGTAATLSIEWTATSLERTIVGYRFAGVDIPRGATIDFATLEFIPDALSSGSAQLSIHGERSGNASPFTTARNNLSDRTSTLSTVRWSPGNWGDTNRQYRSNDIASILQEIVDRSDWCGGNALALMVEGSGQRRPVSRDQSVWEAPALRISYDPATVDFNDTCLSMKTASQVINGGDDAVESATGEVTLDGQALSTADNAAAQRIGFRFQDVDVPASVTITRATLTLTTAAQATGTSSVNVRGERSSNAVDFTSGAQGSLGNRIRTFASRDWTLPADSPLGARVRSIDLSGIVQEIVNLTGWAPGNAVALLLEGDGGANAPVFASSELDNNGAATLQIEYRLDGSDLAGNAVPLRIARDDMHDIMFGLRARGATPLVDAYFEAASYMLGETVDFGRHRGQQTPSDRFYMTSHQRTWAPGELYRPPGCTDVDPGAVACLQESVPEGARYVPPVAGACQTNQIVLLSDGSATRTDSLGRIQTLTGVAECQARSKAPETCGIELASWLNRTEKDAEQDDDRQRVITHTVGFNFSTSFLAEVAQAGGGRFQTASTASELSGVFQTIVNEAADLNTTFVAPAASVNRYNRLTNSDDVYYAMFKPDTYPRWDGNLKRYKLGADPATGETTLLDANDLTIFDPVNGGISAAAQSFWLDDLPGVDGADVAAGGAANQLPAPRDVMTFLYDSAGDPTALVALHEDSVSLTDAVLGLADVDEAYTDELLAWARGVDVLDADGDTNRTEIRQQMGDPLHSNPVILHYGTGDSATSRAFVGTNEGYLHAIDTDSGAEDWAIVPGDLLKNLPTFFDNVAGVDRPYGLDGPITSWHDDSNDNLVVDGAEKAMLIVGMRRGGRNYYAFDVTDPSAPSIRWIIKGGTGDFAALGQTWSRPIKTRMLVSGTPTDVFLFAGGYDPRNDTRAQRDQNDSMGQAIYVVDAGTGALVDTLDGASFLDMDYAVPGDLNAIDIDFDGMADMLFVGDMGGQLWRFDIDNSGNGTQSAAGTSIDGSVIADLNGGGASGNRRFYNSPDVALIALDDGSTVLNVAIGSGWRAHPLDDVVQDRVYSIRQAAVFGPPRGDDGEIDYADTLSNNDLFDATTDSGRSTTSAKLPTGWFMNLESIGEKVLADAITLNGTLLFTSYIPDSGSEDSCGVSVGGGRLYKVDVQYGDAVENLNVGSDDGDNGELTNADRWRNLNVPGIPTRPQVYVGANDPDAPIVVTGDGTEDSGLGTSRRRTYWVEN